MLPPYLEVLRNNLLANRSRTETQDELLVELNLVSEVLDHTRVFRHSLTEGIEHRRMVTSAWGGDPTACFYCGRR